LSARTLHEQAATPFFVTLDRCAGDPVNHPAHLCADLAGGGGLAAELERAPSRLII
jgi:hypothetical protein